MCDNAAAAATRIARVRTLRPRREPHARPRASNDDASASALKYAPIDRASVENGRARAREDADEAIGTTRDDTRGVDAR